MTEDIKLNKAEKAWKPSSKRTAADKDRGEEDADGSKTQVPESCALVSNPLEGLPSEPALTSLFLAILITSIYASPHGPLHPSQQPLNMSLDSMPSLFPLSSRTYSAGCAPS